MIRDTQIAAAVVLSLVLAVLIGSSYAADPKPTDVTPAKVEPKVTGSIKVKMTPAQKRQIADIRKKYRELRKELTAKEDAEIEAVIAPPATPPAKEPGK